MTGFGTTPRQGEALAFIKAFMAQNGKCPSFSEIADGISVKSRGRVTQLLNALEERGHIRRLRDKARAIEIIDHSAPLDLPPAVQAQLDAFCAARGEKAADVIADAVVLHIDAIEASERKEASAP